MSVFKCKMCGAPLNVEEGAKTAQCEYCDSVQTLPKLDDEKRANLYDRASHFRRNNEFDKAMGIYEKILEEDKTDAESYWSLVLCRFGIEYVKDPSTGKMLPTVNRTQHTSIFNDADYRQALQYADDAQRTIYQAEARAINEIQKGILAISQKEEPFDVFICYKETDVGGRRTPDSVLANELYHQLTNEGFKVFFARITLEDKLGSAYEPYIFAALNSAKVMVVLGTRPEYFNAAWVKNEWSRYLALIKNGAEKILIPAYRDMDPYDLPEEFSHLQAQDMSKLGFMQDLIRGIKKIAHFDEPKQPVTVVSSAINTNLNVAPLLERMFMFLEDGDWQSANEYSEKVLDIEPKTAESYLGKLMAELGVKTKEALKDCQQPFDNSNNYQKVLRFGNEELISFLKETTSFIKQRNENARLEGIYRRALYVFKNATNENGFIEAGDLFASIEKYKDSAELKAKCYEKAKEIKFNALYNDACQPLIQDNAFATANGLEKSISIFKSINGWKDSEEKIKECEAKIVEINAKEEEKRKREEAARQEAIRKAKRYRKIAAIVISVLCVVIVTAIVINSVIIPNVKYKNAVSLMEEGKYEEAIEAFKALGGHKDSEDKITECKYNIALSLMEEGKCEEAIEAFEALDRYNDSTTKIEEVKKKISDRLAEIRIEQTKDLLKNCKVGDVIKFGGYEQDNDTSNGVEDIEWEVLEVKDGKALVISKYALDSKRYNEEYENVTWETCTLRSWLNDDFYNTAFGSAEKGFIQSVTITNSDNPRYGTDGGNNTTDKIFLLSIEEAVKYYAPDKMGELSSNFFIDTNGAAECTATEYAKAQGVYVGLLNECSYWWLRSPGYYQNGAAYVRLDNVVCDGGEDVDRANSAVRPALWINFES